MKKSIVLLGSDGTSKIREYLASIIREDRLIVQEVVPSSDSSFMFDEETNPEDRALLLSCELILRAQKKYSDSAKIILAIAFQAWCEKDKQDSSDFGKMKAMSDPQNLKQARDLLRSISGKSYMLSVGVGICFPLTKSSGIRSQLFKDEIELSEISDEQIDSLSLSSKDLRTSGPNGPFDGYFKKFLAIPDDEVPFLACSVSRWIKEQCAGQRMNNMFISKNAFG